MTHEPNWANVCHGATTLSPEEGRSLEGVLHEAPDDVETRVKLERPFSGGSTSALSAARWGPGAYRLVAGEVAPLLALWSRLRNHPRRRTIWTAIRRISFAQENHRLDDRLVDLVIGVESLILGDLNGGREGELSYRSSLRAGHLLGDSPTARREVFKFFKLAYETRSTIAHGGEVDGRKLEARSGVTYRVFVQSLDAHLRRAIVTVLERPEFSDATSKPWDDMLLGPLMP